MAHWRLPIPSLNEFAVQGPGEQGSLQSRLSASCHNIATEWQEAEIDRASPASAVIHCATYHHRFFP